MDRKRIVDCPVCCDTIAAPNSTASSGPPAGFSATTLSRSRLGLSRRDIIAAHWLPNGDLRFYRKDAKMGGVPELVCNYFRNPSATIITAHVNNVIIEYDL
jgi:hypothetical protein